MNPRAAMSVLLLLIAGCASGGLATRTPGRHVLLLSSLAAEDAESLCREADAVADDMAALLCLPPPERPLQIHLFPNSRAARRHLERHCPERARARAVAFTQGGSIHVVLSGPLRREDALRYMRHEIAHSVIMSHFIEVPPWMHEGLALYFESGPPHGTPRADGVLRELRKPLRTDAAGLLRRTVSVPCGARPRRDEYAASWALVHFLLAGDDGPALVTRYLEEVDSRRNAGEQFAEVFGRTPDALAPDWRTYVSALIDGGIR